MKEETFDELVEALESGAYVGGDGGCDAIAEAWEILDDDERRAAEAAETAVLRGALALRGIGQKVQEKRRAEELRAALPPRVKRLAAVGRRVWVADVENLWTAYLAMSGRDAVDAELSDVLGDDWPAGMAESQTLAAISGPDGAALVLELRYCLEVEP